MRTPPGNGLPRLLAHAAAATVETHGWLEAMYDLHVGDHVVLPGELF